MYLLPQTDDLEYLGQQLAKLKEAIDADAETSSFIKKTINQSIEEHNLLKKAREFEESA